MSKRHKLTTTITAHPSGGCDVAWSENGKILGALPTRDRATADLLKILLDRGVAPVDAIYRAFRPKRRPKIGESSAASATYGRAGAAARNASLTPARRKAIAKLAADLRWGTKAAKAAKPVKEPTT
jgi:hypothetical protein